MEWIEIVHLRSYSQQDRNEAVSAFRHLALPDQEKGLRDIVLFRDTALDNDLYIFIHWHDEPSRKGKSPVGLQLAEAFSEFGKINHSLCIQDSKLTVKARKDIHEKQAAL